MSTLSRSTVVALLLVLTLAWVGLSPASAQPRRWLRPPTPEEKVAAIKTNLGIIIPTGPLQTEMPFVKFLEVLERQMPAGNKISFRIHKEAFGKDFDKLAKTLVQLEKFPPRLTVAMALRLAMSKSSLEDDPPVFHVQPTHVAITTLEHTVQTKIYDVADLVKDADFYATLLKRHGAAMQLRVYPGGGPIPNDCDFMGKGGPDWMSEITPKNGASWIVRLIMQNVDAGSWGEGKTGGSIQVLNGTKLKINAPAQRLQEVSYLLDSLRRLADIAVVMNARLLEVDQAFFDKHVAPLLVDDKDKSKTRLAVAIPIELRKQLQRQKVVLAGDDIKIKPDQPTQFLSRQTAYRYRANPGDPEKDARIFRTNLEGVTFHVDAEVSNDRRCMRLKLTQEATQLVKLTKGKKVDLESGKEFEVELPNVKTSSIRATIEIHDGEAIVMPVRYQPSPAKGKTWVLFAEPIIWIEEEEEQIRLGNLPGPAPQTQEEKKKKLVSEPPKTDAVKEVLQALVTDVLTNQDPDWKDLRERFGTPGDTGFSLVDGYDLAWPKWFRPEVPGFQVRPMVQLGKCPGFEPKRLGIRLDALKLNEKDGVLNIAIDNYGGTVNGPKYIRGCFVDYDVRREGKRWVIQWTVMHSP